MPSLPSLPSLPWKKSAGPPQGTTSNGESIEQDSNKVLQDVSITLQSALKHGNENSFEHPRETTDVAIPRVLREARLLVQRHKDLAEKLDCATDTNGLVFKNAKLLEELQKTKKEKSIELLQQHTEHSREMQDLRADSQRVLNEERRRCQSALEAQKLAHERKVREDGSRYEGWYHKSKQLEKDVNDLKHSYRKLSEQYKKADENCRVLQESQTTHEAAMNQLRENYRVWKEQSNIEHELEVENLKTKHVSETNRFQGKWESEKRELRERFEKSEVQLRRTHQVAVEQLNNEKAQIKQDFETRKVNLEATHTSAMAILDIEKKNTADEFRVKEEKINKAHAQETDRLRRDIQSRNKAFVSRDTFTPVTDGGLKSTFFDIIREVDTISRLKWAFNNSPWTDSTQTEMTDNPKRLQKQILQDTIWEALFEFIFCTPFRVFGAEGLALEKQWVQVFGKHHTAKNKFYTWPEPNFGAEKWRYETMRSCQDTVKTATSAYDNRTRLREGYHESLKSIQEKIEMPLKLVSDIDENLKEPLATLIKNAADTWILFGTQRCRVMIVIQDLNTEIESKAKKGGPNDYVDLIIRPELRRIGDSDGGSLEKEQTIAGCEGEIKRIMHNGL